MGNGGWGVGARWTGVGVDVLQQKAKHFHNGLQTIPKAHNRWTSLGTQGEKVRGYKCVFQTINVCFKRYKCVLIIRNVFNPFFLFL